MTRPLTTRLPPDQRRRQIVEHALELFAERGPGDVSFNELAQRLQLSRGLLYHYFPGRVADVYLAALELALSRGLTMVDLDAAETPAAGSADSADSSADSSADVDVGTRVVGFESALERVIGSPDFAMVMRARGSVDPRVHAALDAANDELVRFVATSLLGLDQPPPLVAVAIGSYFSFVHEAIRHWSARPDVPRAEFIAYLLRAFEMLIAAASA